MRRRVRVRVQRGPPRGSDPIMFPVATSRSTSRSCGSRTRKRGDAPSEPRLMASEAPLGKGTKNEMRSRAMDRSRRSRRRRDEEEEESLRGVVGEVIGAPREIPYRCHTCCYSGRAVRVSLFPPRHESESVSAVSPTTTIMGERPPRAPRDRKHELVRRSRLFGKSNGADAEPNRLVQLHEHLVLVLVHPHPELLVLVEHRGLLQQVLRHEYPSKLCRRTGPFLSAFFSRPSITSPSNGRTPATRTHERADPSSMPRSPRCSRSRTASRRGPILDDFVRRPARSSGRWPPAAAPS